MGKSVLDNVLRDFDEETIFIFGHAYEREKCIGNKEDIKLFIDYLEKLLRFVGKGIKTGKLKGEII